RARLLRGSLPRDPPVALAPRRRCARDRYGPRRARRRSLRRPLRSLPRRLPRRSLLPSRLPPRTLLLRQRLRRLREPVHLPVLLLRVPAPSVLLSVLRPLLALLRPELLLLAERLVLGA